MRISDWSSDVCSSDLNQAWPVFLGRARFDPEDNPPLAADPSGRRYGGVRAERVEAPSGTATLELGLGTDGASHVAWNVETALGVRTLLDIAADGQIDRKSTRLNSSH